MKTISMDCKIKNTIKCEDLPIVISDDDAPKTIGEVKTCIKSKPKRKVLLKTKESNIETLIVSQKVKVKKQNIKCVINLNTNVFDDAAHKALLPENKTLRIVPTCGRKKCKAAIKIKREPKQRKRTLQVAKQSDKICRCKRNQLKNEKKHYRSDKQKINKDKLSSKFKKADRELSLSPISLSPLENDEISYDSISVNSFTSCSEIDTLIKRTKQRESNSFKSQPLYSSISQDIIEISSDDETSDVNDTSIKSASIHSLATLVLEPVVDSTTYSPKSAFNEDLNSVKLYKKQDVPKYSGYSFEVMQSVEKPYEEKVTSTSNYSAVDKINNNVDYDNDHYKIFQTT
ncbi:hypothetical protein evm_010742 [Chilo suppressalis]|nr:hypothetical protein evm_010742 [Chilo suppressalis]